MVLTRQQAKKQGIRPDGGDVSSPALTSSTTMKVSRGESNGAAAPVAAKAERDAVAVAAGTPPTVPAPDVRSRIFVHLCDELDARGLEIITSTGAVVARGSAASEADLRSDVRTSVESRAITDEFARDSWVQLHAADRDEWVGFHYFVPETQRQAADGADAGLFFIQEVLGVTKVGATNAAYVEHVDPKRTTLFPQRFWFEPYSTRMNAAALALAKRASTLVMKRAGKGTLRCVKFAYNDFDVWSPCYIYVGWDKHSPNCLCGATWRGDQDFYHFGDRVKKDAGSDRVLRSL